MAKKKLMRTVRPGACPVCGCKELEYGSMKVEGLAADYEATCPACGYEGMECYDLKFTGYFAFVDTKFYKAGHRVKTPIHTKEVTT